MIVKILVLVYRKRDLLLIEIGGIMRREGLGKKITSLVFDMFILRYLLEI